MKVSLLLVAVVISLCSHAQLKPSSSERIEHLAKRAGDLRLSHADSAIAMAMEVRDWGKRNREYHTQVRGNLLLADIYYYKNEREKGFSYLTEALDVCEKHKMEAESIDIYYSIGLHYSRNARRPDGSSDTQTLEKALSYHTKGKKLAEKYQLPGVDLERI
jgi:hypothetical protein